MTLFLLLVTVAAVTPFVAIALEASRLGIVGSVVGFCLAAVVGVAQFVGHHKLCAAIVGKVKDGRVAGLLVGTYYLAILLLGGLCTAFTLYVARNVADLIRLPAV